MYVQTGFASKLIDKIEPINIPIFFGPCTYVLWLRVVCVKQQQELHMKTKENNNKRPIHTNESARSKEP